MPQIFVRVLQVSTGSVPMTKRNRFRRLVVSATINPLGKRKAYLFRSREEEETLNHMFQFKFNEGEVNFLSLSLRKKSFALLDPMIGYDVIDLSQVKRNTVTQEIRCLRRKIMDKNCGELIVQILLCDDNVKKEQQNSVFANIL